MKITYHQSLRNGNGLPYLTFFNPCQIKKLLALVFFLLTLVKEMKIIYLN
jgi:hypothetical protein